MSADWPFQDPMNVITFTVSDIVEKRAPILFVSHEAEDGFWQFLTGGDLPEKKEWLLVTLSHVVAVDSSVRELADLPLGYSATRASIGASWQRWKSPGAEHEEA